MTKDAQVVKVGNKTQTQMQNVCPYPLCCVTFIIMKLCWLMHKAI